MKIVHFADLHLDAAFAWCGATGDAARRRRQALRNTLLRIVELVREVSADALLCAGDLYEHERVTPDTAAFLKRTFAEIGPVPVFIAPGNHDWYGPQSIYANVEWSENVHIFKEPVLRPVTLIDGITLWGGAHCAPANTDNFLDGGFHTEGGGVHIALFHAAELSWLSEQGEGKLPHAPFDAIDIEYAGLDYAFLGHYHRPKDAVRHTYPGNPDPLQFGEDGPRGPVIATVSPSGFVTIERRPIAVTEVHDCILDVTDCTTYQEVRTSLIERTQGLSGVLRLTIEGELARTLDLEEKALYDALGEFDAVQVRVGNLRSGYDIDSIRQEQTVRGEFVNNVLEKGLESDEERRILITGLRALDGRSDLEVL